MTMPTTEEFTAAQYQERSSEADMRATVKELVERKGGRLFFVRRSDVAPELVDLPDWLIILPRPNGTGVVILAEAKSVKRNLTQGQGEFLELCRECTRFESFVVRAANPRDGEISYDAFLDFLSGGD